MQRTASVAIDAHRKLTTSYALIHRSRVDGVPSQIVVLGIPLQQSLAIQEAADLPREGLGQSADLGARRRLQAAESERSVGTLDIHAIEE